MKLFPACLLLSVPLSSAEQGNSVDLLSALAAKKVALIHGVCMAGPRSTLNFQHGETFSPMNERIFS